MSSPAKKRQDAIKDLVSHYPIEDQLELVELLKKKYGIETNQAQVSRDLRRLQISKQSHPDKKIYSLPSHNVHRDILLLGIQDIDCNESMIVIRTMPGIAPFVGDYIDQQENLEILGSIAGENTIFIVPRSARNIQETCKALCHALFFKKGSLHE